ncbi:MAG: amidohydrolase, partial [Bacteroidales bacterium]|nr:amidohydrolase [Bacteroidales bacterium]
SDTIEDKEAEVFDATNLAVLPAFYNMHAHSSMSLLRGFCEDLPLFDWLNNIWKREATLSAEDIYNGTRLAILEMIKSGTVFFADMYWHHSEIIRAVEEMGIRANVGICFMNSLGRKTIEENFDFAKNPTITKPSLVNVSIAPHAIYTCDKDLYKECYSFAKELDLIFHTHLSETQKEVEDSLKENSMRPVEYLNSLGVLDSKTLLAHCVHLSEKEAEILSQTRSTLVHNPCSNMKLASGVFDSRQAKKYNCNIALGTDGNSSNNNLSMIEEMKIASLLAKVHYLDSEEGNSNQVFQWATKNGAEAVGINAGEIKEGKLADIVFVNLNDEKMIPNYNIISNLIYSVDTKCIDSVMCNGKFLMKHQYVEGEEEIIEIAQRYK